MAERRTGIPDGSGYPIFSPKDLTGGPLPAFPYGDAGAALSSTPMRYVRNGGTAPQGFGISLPGAHGAAAPMMVAPAAGAQTVRPSLPSSGMTGAASPASASPGYATSASATTASVSAVSASARALTQDAAEPSIVPAVSQAVLVTPAVTAAGTTTATLSSPQLLDFTLSGPQALGKGFSYSLPSQLYHSFSQPIGGGGDGFSVSGNVSVSGGIKGNVTGTAPSILPNLPLEMNPETLSYVQQQQTFSVTPTLISVDDAGFSLNLPSLTGSLGFGLQATAGVSLNLPSVSIGFTGPLGNFYGYTYTPDPISVGPITIGKFINLPTNAAIDFPGGSASVSEIAAASAQASLVSQSASLISQNGGSLAPITQTFHTKPFLQLNFDAVQAIAKYVPELKELDGSVDFGVGSASWSLLQLPLYASLGLADTITMSEAGFTADVKEAVHGGAQKDLGTVAVGHELDIQAPSYSGSGYGEIALELDYALTLNVKSVISLFGSFDLSINGPQASASILGYGFGFGPVFSADILNIDGNIATISTTTEQVTLNSIQHDLVFYGTNASAVTVTTSQNATYQLRASGELLTVQSGVVISGSANGINGTLGAAGIYNNGSVYAVGGAGIYLPKGGKIVNSGGINQSVTSSHFHGSAGYGIEIGGRYSTVINTGRIGLDATVNNVASFGIAVAGIKAMSSGTGSADTLFVYNDAGGYIGARTFGIWSTSQPLDVHNDGTIFAKSGYGVSGANGVSLYNDASGHVDGAKGAVFGTGATSFIENQGQIGTGGASNIGVSLTGGNLFNFGTIEGQTVGVQIGSSSGSDLSVVYNAGLIEGSHGKAVSMMGASNTLMIAPGARFVGGVYANPNNDPNSNVITLLAGTSIGTFSTTNGYIDFGQIGLASAGAGWLLETTAGAGGFSGATISGFSSLDRIGLTGQAFQYGDHVAFNNNTGGLTLLDPNGSTISTVNLTPGQQAGARWHVSGSPSETFIREFTGAHFTNVITGTVAAQVINANSYFGPTAGGTGVTVAHGAAIFYAYSSYPAKNFALDLKPVTLTTTVTTGSTVSVTQVVQSSTLFNDGYVEGNQEGVLLEGAGSIYNDRWITGKVTGIVQSAGVAGATITNSAFVYGDNNGIVLNSGGLVRNLGGEIWGNVDGIVAPVAATIANAATIFGASTAGIVLKQGGVVLNSSTGTITGGATGVQAAGTTVNVTNAGSIGGKVGVSLANGGGVSNTYNLVGGVPVWGTITGSKFGVVVSGAAGTITNGVGTLGGAPSPALIQGVSLAAGGGIVNGRYGVIEGNSTYSVVLAPAGAGTVANAGTIGAIRVSRGDLVANAASGTIQAISGVGGKASATLSIQNAGVIGGISTGVAAYLYNAGTVENGIQWMGGGTIVDSGALTGGITFGTLASRLVLTPQSFLDGNIVANSVDTLELNGVGGVIAYLGNHYTGFGTSILDAGSSWGFVNGNTLTGNWTIAGTLVSDEPVTSTGTVSITGMVEGLYGSGSPIFGFPGQVGLYVAAGTVSNAGVILGARSGGGAPATYGVVMTGGTVINIGSIGGGNASYGSGYGGSGVSLSGGVLINSGRISAGSSRYSKYDSAYGQAGVDMTGGATVSNSGLILGGYGDGIGGAGVQLAGGLLENTGTIQGGGSGQTGGVGVTITGGNLVTSGTISGVNGADAVAFGNNSGTLTLDPGAVFNGVVAGFAGAGDVLELSGTTSGTLSGLGTEFVNFPEITQDFGSNWTLAGANTLGAGVTLASADTLVIAGSLLNHGVIAARQPDYGSGTPGYLGISLANGTLTNAGTISGGYGRYLEAPGYGGDGGGGVAASGGVLINQALIEGASGTVGGHGYDPSFSGHNGDGGIGVSLGSGATLSNSGTILGGGGGPTYRGGAGVVSQGGSITNNGRIAGGSGYAGGGVGVYLNGGMLTNSATISGANGADAVLFGAQAGTLAINHSAIFNGLVEANAGVADVLMLQGNTGTLTGLGTEFVGFSVLRENSAASWTVSGSQSFGGDAQILGSLTVASGTLTLGGALSGNGSIALRSGAGIDLAGTGTIAQAVTGAGALDIQGSLALATSTFNPGSLTIASGGTLSGTGTISSTLENDGLITATGGTLTVSSKLAGTGALGAAAGSVLKLTKGGILNEAVTGAGTLDLAGTWTAGSVKPIATSTLLIEAGASLAKTAGIIAASSQVLGTLMGTSGTLTVKGAVSGTGALAAASGSELILAGGGSFAGALKGAGTIALTAPITLTAGVTLGVGTLLDDTSITLGANVKLANGAGHVFDIQASTKASVTISGAAGSGLSNAGVMLANGLGSATVQMSFINNGTLTNSNGTLMLAGTVTNTGVIQASSGLLGIQQRVIGAGTMLVGATGTLSLGGTVAVGETVDFHHSSGVLDLGTPLGFQGTIADFSGSGGVDLLSTTVTSESYASNVLTLRDGTTVVGRLTFAGTYTAASFSLKSDGHGGTMITSA